MDYFYDMNQKLTRYDFLLKKYQSSVEKYDNYVENYKNMRALVRSKISRCRSTLVDQKNMNTKLGCQNLKGCLHKMRIHTILLKTVLPKFRPDIFKYELAESLHRRSLKKYRYGLCRVAAYHYQRAVNHFGMANRYLARANKNLAIVNRLYEYLPSDFQISLIY